MFDIGWQELFIVAILALLVVGPKDLPKALRLVTTWIRKLKGMAREFQGGVNDMIRESELDELRKEVNTQVLEAEKDIKDTTDVSGDLSNALDISDVEKSFETVNAPPAIEDKNKSGDKADAS